MEKRSSAFNLLSPVDTVTVPPEIPKGREGESPFFSPPLFPKRFRDGVFGPAVIMLLARFYLVAFARPVLVLLSLTRQIEFVLKTTLREKM